MGFGDFPSFENVVFMNGACGLFEKMARCGLRGTIDDFQGCLVDWIGKDVVFNLFVGFHLNRCGEQGEFFKGFKSFKNNLLADCALI